MVTRTESRTPQPIRLVSFIALALFVAALAGCGGKPAATPAAAPVPTAAVQATTAPTQAPTATQPAPSPTAKPTAVPTAKPTALPPTATATEPAPTAEATAPSPSDQPDVPAPADAKALAYDSEMQEITYTSPSDISKLVAFYRQALPGKGWKEVELAAVANDNLGYLEFLKGDASLTLTMIHPVGGSESQVTVDTSGYATNGQQVAEATSVATGEAPAGQSGADALKAEDKDGLPVPADYTSYAGDASTYSHSVTATSPTDLKTMLVFYRRELLARKWSELPSAKVTDTAATLHFEDAGKQPLVLKLARNADGGTDIEVTSKLEAVAKKAGILPAAGKARIYLGNVSDGPVVFAIAGKEFKVTPQAPSQSSMEGVPYVDVAPANLDYSLTLPGKPAVKDKIEVGADQTWGLIAGPNGALPIQLY